MLKNCGHSTEMERTRGEPDVVGHDKKTREYIVYDCSAESPKGRRSFCYDREALESRKPKNSAIDMATAMGIELLTKEQYRELQKLGTFDTKTSSWMKTPPAIRRLGGALFCDRRYAEEAIDGDVEAVNDPLEAALERQHVARSADRSFREDADDVTVLQFRASSVATDGLGIRMRGAILHTWPPRL